MALPAGRAAPDFTLNDGSGREHRLSQLLERGPVALVFVRSADWCGFCRQQLQALERGRPQFDAAGLQIVAVSYDAPAVNAAAVTKLGLSYPLLADVGSEVIDRYGVRNYEAKGRAAGIPHPTIFLIDRAGEIRAQLSREKYQERPEQAEILEAARRFLPSMQRGAPAP